MEEVQWIKLYIGMFNNKKIKYIRKLPEGSDILLTWVMLLTSAGRCNANGYIFLTENIPYSPEMLSNEFELPLNTIKLALATFQNLNMINVDEQGIVISNWGEYQNIDGLEKIKEQNRLRAARYRENQKLLNESNVTDNVTVTQSNGTDIEEDKELDKDKELEIKKDIIMTPDEANYIKLLETIPNYPIDRARDIEYYHNLETKYPTLDLIEALKDWSIYKLDKPLKPKDNPRAQINTSFKNYVKWGKCLKGGNNGTSGQPNGKQSNWKIEIPTREYKEYTEAELAELGIL